MFRYFMNGFMKMQYRQFSFVPTDSKIYAANIASYKKIKTMHWSVTYAVMQGQQ